MDFKFIIFWWLNILILGLLSLPFVFLIFRKFWDKGYIFSKIISIGLLTYTVFIFSFLKFLPFSNTSIFILILAFIIFDLIFLFRFHHFPQFLQNIKNNYRFFIFEEILFFLILSLWSYVRGFAPDIEGLEKFMDWGFVNSMLRTQFMPPVDMWFSGQPINYYYFGHLIFAFLTKISNIPSAITYNLSIATVCALTFVSGFSLSSNLTHLLLNSIKKINSKAVIFSGIISALMLTFGGNLHAIYKIAKIDIQNNNGHLILTENAISKAAQSYWYPDATRFIGFDPDVKDKTIHEFPFYSFIVADLHGHMNDIPIIVLFISFLLATITLEIKSLISWYLVIPSGFILALAYMTNAWDFAIYGLLFAFITFFINLKSSKFPQAFYKTFLNGILTIFFWFLFTLPFSLNFTPMGEGLRLSDTHSPFYQLFILYGGFWLISLPFVLFLIINFFIPNNKKILNIDLFAFLLIIIATILVIIPEIGYIKDIYIYEHRRANTMFKLVYQAFIMYALVSGYVLIRFKFFIKSQFLKLIYSLIFFLVFISHLTYSYFALKSYYGFKTYYGLWGLNFLQKNYPDNLAAIEWINKNIQGQPVILEAVGDSYTTFNQISVATGLPTVEGWVVHEWLWRGGYDKPAARQKDVETIYTSLDQKEVSSLLQKYSVKYIFVGAKEYEKYPNLNEEMFSNLGAKVIFQQGTAKIYQL